MHNLLKTAVKGLSILVVLKLFSKIVDFILNILVIREIDPNIYGNNYYNSSIKQNYF